MKKYFILGVLFVLVLSGCEKEEIENKKELKSLGHGYIADGESIYYQQEKIEKIDYETFEVLVDEDINKYGKYGYSKDKNNVYFRNNKIENTDTSSFEILPLEYSKDKNNVYYYGEKIEGADSKTFKVQGKVGVDKNKCYMEGNVGDISGSGCGRFLK